MRIEEIRASVVESMKLGHVSVYQLAQRLDGIVSQRSVYDFFDAKKANIRMQTVLEICNACKVSWQLNVHRVPYDLRVQFAEHNKLGKFRMFGRPTSGKKPKRTKHYDRLKAMQEQFDLGQVMTAGANKNAPE